jgi:hypothetical protein
MLTIGHLFSAAGPLARPRPPMPVPVHHPRPSESGKGERLFGYNVTKEIEGVSNIFLAGIIQGSLAESAIHSQDYRPAIKRLLAECLPQAQVYCPVAAHPNSLAYDDARGRSVFLDHVRMARESDLVVAYLPSASMGTAIELWEAHRHGTPTVAITPLAVNWVVRFLCDLVVADLDEFAAACRDGRVAALLRPKVKKPQTDTDEHG